MTKSKAVEILVAAGLSWEASVFTTNRSVEKSVLTRMLIKAATLVQSGHKVETVSFTMPYDGMAVDGLPLDRELFLSH